MHEQSSSWKVLESTSLSSFSEVRPGCQKSSPSFHHLEKVAAFSSPFLLQCKQLSNDTDIAAWLTATTTRLLSSLWPRQQSPSPTLPLPSSFPFPLSLCIFVRAAKVHQSQQNRAACSAAAAFACNLLHFVTRKLQQTALGCRFAQLLDSWAGGKFHVPLNRVPHASPSSGLNSAPSVSICLLAPALTRNGVFKINHGFSGTASLKLE